MVIVNRKTDELIPYSNNPRYNDESVRPVARSIEKFGFKVPIVITSDNVIVSGHTRLKAAKLLKLDTVPAIVADDLTEDQITAFRLADNKAGERSQWDDGLLAQELKKILDFDMADFGFAIDKLEEAENGSADEGEQGEEGHTEFAELEQSHHGDVWILGRHRLICGDPSDLKDLEKLYNMDLTNLKGIMLNLKSESAKKIIARAESKGKTAYCIEKEPKNVDAAIENWEAITGQKAVKEVKQHEEIQTTEGTE